ncbi:MAG: acyltransferase [Ferruginibacter sp.]
MQTNAIDKEKYFFNLDALRFIAFLGVFFSHTLRWQPTGKIPDFLITIFTLNYFGVPFFFTLSSFLITFNLLSEKIKYGKISLLKFYTNRSLRIWPIYFLMVMFYFFILPPAARLLHIHPPTLAPILPFLFFYVNFYVIEHGNNISFIILILWSISIEEQFYFFWGVTFRYIKINLLAFLLLSLMIFSIIFSYYYGVALNKPRLSIHTLYVIQNFIPGALLAWIFLTQKEIYRRITRIPSKYIMTVYILLPLAYISLYDVDIILMNIVMSICFSVIIYDQALNTDRVINFGRFPVINYLGKISYGLYIYHALVITILEKIFHFFGAESESSLFINILHIMTAFLITVAISHLSYKYLELKFLAMKIKKRKIPQISEQT